MQSRRRTLDSGEEIAVLLRDTTLENASNCAERIRARDADVIVVWNTPAADQPAEDDPYKDFPIPDDLMW